MTGAGHVALTLHAHQLLITDTPEYTSAAAAPVKATTISYDLGLQTVTIGFAAALPEGRGTLKLAFAGKLNDELAGWYRSKYTLRGAARNMAVTQFEATDARRCFPCWDEPACKASFKLTVSAPADRTVVSNTHVERVETASDGRTRVWSFAETPVMATYLVAAIVGDFDALSARGANGVLTTVYVPVGKTHLGRFALDVAVKSLDLLETLFGVPFMGTKNDHLAIPDFAAGAMENTGCITYREAALLVDDKESSVATLQRVAQVVAHEISHQVRGAADLGWGLRTRRPLARAHRAAFPVPPTSRSGSATGRR